MDKIEKPSIAMVSSVGIGDAVVYLIVAHNLSLNGFNITFYSNPMAQLQDWLPGIKVKPYPKVDECDKEFLNYDLVISDPISVVAKPHHGVDEFEELSKKYIFLGVGCVEKELRFDHTDIISKKLSAKLAEKCKELANCAGEIRFQGGDRNKTQVQSAIDFCKFNLKLNDVEKSSGFKPDLQKKLCFMKNSKRVLIHPYSSSPTRNWTFSKILQLSRLLKKEGWEPVFTVSPAERPDLLRELKDEFPAPVFETLSKFADYIYESKIMIGSDSGSVNLASSLGLPTVSLSRRGKNHRWRPDWTPHRVVLPYMKFKCGSKRIWQPFVTVRMVHRAFESLIKEIEHNQG